MNRPDSPPRQLNPSRCRRLIDDAIKSLQLDLKDLVVLTEAVTGYYALTSLIAAIGGSECVLALTQDSRFGSVSDVIAQTTSLARQFGVEDRIHIFVDRNEPRLGDADIVTNLGFVRAIDVALLERLKKTVAISLMCETWEYREQDVDLERCRQLGIPVLGTNENHPDLRIFSYVGHLALKLLFELDIEVVGSHVIVVGSHEFGKAVCNSLTATGAQVTSVVPEDGMSLGETDVKRKIAEADAIVFAEHRVFDLLLGPGGPIGAHEIASLNPGIVVAHISGNIEVGDLEAHHIQFRPQTVASPGYMSITTDYLGPRPLVNLHAAGLKVGECLARARRAGFSGSSAENTVLQTTPLAQGF